MSSELAGLTLFLLLTGCRPEPLRGAPAWSKDLDVTDLGDGTCVIVAGGSIRCDGRADPASANALEVRFKTVRDSGFSHTVRCALTEDGRVACWGCGVPQAGTSPAPVSVLPLTGVVQIEVGDFGACALKSSGTVTCWGRGPFNPPGSPVDNFDICAPRSVFGFRRQPFPPAVRMAMVPSGRICVVTASGDVFCDATYQPPNDSTSPILPRTGNPPVVPTAGVRKLDIPKARDVAAGEDHFCALAIDGTVTCWDENSHGQAGAPTEQCVTAVYGGCKVKPTRVRLARPATAVALGREHSCAILDNGKVACWGNNNDGKLGFASDVHCHPFWRGFCSPVPGIVQGVNDVAALVVPKRIAQTWALTNSGRIASWPEQVPQKSESRRPVGPCDSTAGALTPEEVERREDELKGKRTRVRGRVSKITLDGRRFWNLGNLYLYPLTPEPEDGEVIIDGIVARVRGADFEPLGIYVYDACRVQRD